MYLTFKFEKDEKSL